MRVLVLLFVSVFAKQSFRKPEEIGIEKKN